jgi:hypothetical protein
MSTEAESDDSVEVYQATLQREDKMIRIGPRGPIDNHLSDRSLLYIAFMNAW